MHAMFLNFWTKEDGAVTVDWVVLTAAVVGLGFSVVVIFADGNATLADAMSDKVAEIAVTAGD